MTSFSIDWLDLRETADRRARNSILLEQAKHWLANEPAPAIVKTIVDLGAGTGSTLRAFSMISKSSTLISDRQLLNWRLVDQDAELLAEARLRHSESHRLETYELDLTDIAGLPLEGTRLITASALFDLVSADFIDKIVAALQSQQQPVGIYTALNYDGVTCWAPAHPLDEVVLDAFNRDQHRDKGFGVSLGPHAVPYMEQVLESSGFTVFTVNSPWVLEGNCRKLVNALISGIGDAVAGDSALAAEELQCWVEFRMANSAKGTCIVGHKDLLALPDEA